jgi:hypothetical protein
MRVIFLLVILHFTVSCSSLKPSLVEKFNVEPNQILLVVKVTDARYTEHSTTPCTNENCITTRTWVVYNASILDVIYGEYSKDDISFAHLQHTYYTDEVTKKWYILLAYAKSMRIQTIQ